MYESRVLFNNWEKAPPKHMKVTPLNGSQINVNSYLLLLEQDETLYLYVIALQTARPRSATLHSDWDLATTLSKFCRHSLPQRPCFLTI